ncbi:MAG TPA: hypothetical protein VK171_07345 [Fimbriimonas sp.]|nr:hypothetical protein [Fimbriimonas sp.]
MGLIVMEFDSREKIRKSVFWHGRMSLTRLGCCFPVAIWPVLIWIQSHGTYSTGRHSAEALAAVGTEAGITNLVLSLFGVVLVFLGELGAGGLRVLAVVWLIVHYFMVERYIHSQAVWYV